MQRGQFSITLAYMVSVIILQGNKGQTDRIFLHCFLLFTVTNTFKKPSDKYSSTCNTKTKNRSDQVKSFSSHILPCCSALVQAGHFNNLQKGFSQNILYGSERERRLERGPVSECFIISNVAFPEALSKVSELREPELETLNPLVTTWSKATLHFLIFALKREPLHGLCVWTQWCFLFNSIFARMFESVGFRSLRRRLDMIRTGAIFLGRWTRKV